MTHGKDFTEQSNHTERKKADANFNSEGIILALFHVLQTRRVVTTSVLAKEQILVLRDSRDISGEITVYKIF
jgi:hypothetical protein